MADDIRRQPMFRALHCIGRAKLDNETNFERSGPLLRALYYTPMSNHGGGWRDFPAEMVEWFRRAFASKTELVGILVDGQRCVVNWKFMVIVRHDGCIRSVAWIDANGKCFFPKRSVHCGCWAEDGAPTLAITRSRLNQAALGRPVIPDLNLEPSELED